VAGRDPALRGSRSCSHTEGRLVFGVWWWVGAAFQPRRCSRRLASVVDSESVKHGATAAMAFSDRRAPWLTARCVFFNNRETPA